MRPSDTLSSLWYVGWFLKGWLYYLEKWGLEVQHLGEQMDSNKWLWTFTSGFSANGSLVKVSNLILLESGSWKYQLISSCFDPYDARWIMRIPLFWGTLKVNSFGRLVLMVNKYTTRFWLQFCYRQAAMGVSLDTDPREQVWTKLWNVQALPRCKEIV